MVEFLRATLRSIRKNEEIRQFLSNITGGNTRAVIELITSFCGSPNVEAEKIIALERAYGDYLVPLHEFTKHALLGEYAYFNPHSSLVACNVFDVTAADPREHFLSCLLVSYLTSNIGTRDNDGFVSGDTIVSEMLRHNFLEEQTVATLRRLAQKRLVETPHAHFREVAVPEKDNPKQFYFRATTVGVYHVRYWAGSFAFLDATSTDTPIFDEFVRDEVSRLAGAFEISRRYKRSMMFRDYLEAAWRTSEFEAAYFDFGTLVDSQARTFETVKHVVGKNKFNSARLKDAQIKGEKSGDRGRPKKKGLGRAKLPRPR